MSESENTKSAGTSVDRSLPTVALSLPTRQRHAYSTRDRATLQASRVRRRATLPRCDENQQSSGDVFRNRNTRVSHETPPPLPRQLENSSAVAQHTALTNTTDYCPRPLRKKSLHGAPAAPRMRELWNRSHRDPRDGTKYAWGRTRTR